MTTNRATILTLLLYLYYLSTLGTLYLYSPLPRCIACPIDDAFHGMTRVHPLHAFFYGHSRPTSPYARTCWPCDNTNVTIASLYCHRPRSNSSVVFSPLLL